MREETVKGAESPRCVGNLTPSFFPAFYLFKRASFAIFLPLYRARCVTHIFLSPALRRRRLTLERGRSSPPFDYPQETSAISPVISRWREGYTPSSSCQIHGKRFSAKPGIRDILYVAFMLDSLDEREAIRSYQLEHQIV